MKCVGHDHCVDTTGSNGESGTVCEDGRLPADAGPVYHSLGWVDDDAEVGLDSVKGPSGASTHIEDTLNWAFRTTKSSREFLTVRPRSEQIVQSGESVEDGHVTNHTTCQVSYWQNASDSSQALITVLPHDVDVYFAVIGWPSDGPTLRLDHTRFSYAGKFVMSSTGKAVAREGKDGDVVAATAFDADRTEADRLRIRYVTVRDDRRAEGIGPGLLRFTAERGRERGYDAVNIAVNNPFAYEAAYRAGFVFTGEEAGLAELRCDYRPTVEPSTERYQDGLARYRERDLTAEEESFLAAREGTGPPDVVQLSS